MLENESNYRYLSIRQGNLIYANQLVILKLKPRRFVKYSILFVSNIITNKL